MKILVNFLVNLWIWNYHQIQFIYSEYLLYFWVKWFHNEIFRLSTGFHYYYHYYLNLMNADWFSIVNLLTLSSLYCCMYTLLFHGSYSILFRESGRKFQHDNIMMITMMMFINFYLHIEVSHCSKYYFWNTKLMISHLTYIHWDR